MRPFTTKERMQELLDYYKISQVDLSRRTGISQAEENNYVLGKRIPKQNNISKIAEAYNIDPAWLMGYDVPMKRVTDLIEDSFDSVDYNIHLTKKQVDMLTAFENADESTKRMVLYALKIME